MSEWSKFLSGSNRSLYSQAHTHAILLDRIMLEVPRGGRILEAGCGLAFLSKLLSDAGYTVVAGDVDPEVLKAAQSTGLQSPAIEYKIADLFKLADGHAGTGFDAVVHSGVLEHFSDEQIVEAMTQQRQIAQKLIFKIPNSRSKMTAAHFGNERFLTNAHWVKLAKAGGYRSVQVFGGETLPAWTYVLPGLLQRFPRYGQKAANIRILERSAAWRRGLSRHSVFVCE